MFAWIFPALLAAILLLWTLFFPQLGALWIRQGYQQVIQSLMPSLFLPMVVTNFIFLSPLRLKLERFFKLPGRLLFGMNASQTGVMIFGLLCGFPTGILLAKELLEQGEITPGAYRRLCLVSNNCGVGFIFSFLGSRLSLSVALLLFLSQLSSCILLTRLLPQDDYDTPTRSPTLPQDYTLAFVTAVKKTVAALAYMAGFVIFFSFVSRLIVHFVCRLFPDAQSLSALIGAFLEISGGCPALSDLKHAPVFCAWAVGWGGLSVWAQSKMAAQDAGLPRAYLACKLLHAFLCALFYHLFSLFVL